MVNSKHLLLSASTLGLLTALSVTSSPLPANATSPLSALPSRGVENAQPLKQKSNTPSISEDSQNFIKDIAERGIGFMANTELSEENREKEFRIMLEESFDMKTIGRFALGKYWRQATKEQKKEYLKLFENMIVNIYSRRFGDYNGEKFNVISARPTGAHDAIVASQIIPGSGASISIDWRVRKKDKHFVVIDIIVAGVSMALTQRSDFSAVIQRGGGKIDVLLEHLRK